MTAQTACAVLAGGQLMEGKGSLAPIAMSPRPPKHSKRPGVSNSPRYSRARSSAIHGKTPEARILLFYLLHTCTPSFLDDIRSMLRDTDRRQSERGRPSCGNCEYMGNEDERHRGNVTRRA